MGLPSPAQLQDLSSRISQVDALIHGKWGDFKAVSQNIALALGPQAVSVGTGLAVSAATGSQAASTATQVAVSIGSASTAVVSIAPITSIIAPWIAVVTIAAQAGTIFSLHDIKNDIVASQGGRATRFTYRCNCGGLGAGTCFDAVKYIVDKKERNVGLVAVHAFTFSATFWLKKAHSIGKKIYYKASGNEGGKTTASKTIVANARKGCTSAMATIFLLAGSWTMLGDRDRKTLEKATAIISSSDGWEVFKEDW